MPGGYEAARSWEEELDYANGLASMGARRRSSPSTRPPTFSAEARVDGSSDRPHAAIPDSFHRARARRCPCRYPL